MTTGREQRTRVHFRIADYGPVHVEAGRIHRSRRRSLVALVMLIVVAVVAIISRPRPLLGSAGTRMKESAEMRPGGLLSMGFNFSADSGQPVQLISARVLGVPAGVKVVWMRAMDTRLTQSIIGAVRDLKGFPPDAFFPLSHARWDPGIESPWQIVATVRAPDTFGTYVTKGIEVTYTQVGANLPQVQAFPFQLELDVQPAARGG